MDLNRINSIRICYQNECRDLLSSWQNEYNKAKSEIDTIKKKDYAKEYEDMFKVSLQTLDEIFDKWVEIQKNTFGLTFKLADYYRQVKPRSIEHGKIMEHVQKVVDEVNRAVKDVENSKSVKDDEEPQKRFVQAYVDMIYITQNGRRLVEEANIPQTEKAEDLVDPEQRFKKYGDLLKRGIVQSELKCFNDITRLKSELQNEIIRGERVLLSPGTSHVSDDFEVLIGLKKNVKVDNEALNFMVNDLGIPDADKLFTSSPVYFRPRNDKSSLIVRASSELFNGIDYLKVLKKLYFTFIDSFSPRKMTLFGMEQLDTRTLLSSFQDTVIKKIGLENTVIDGRFVESDRMFEEKIQALNSEYNRRENQIVFENGYDNIFDFNESRNNSSDRLNPILFIINNYPNGFTNKPRLSKIVDTIVKTGGRYGIFTILFEQNPVEAREDDEYILYEQSNTMDVLDIDSYGNATYNKEPISFNIYANDFSEDAFIRYLKDINENETTTDLLEFVKHNEKPSEPFYKLLSIPIGKSDSKVIKMDLKPGSTMCNMFLGGTSGTGKSYFLHSLIMNAAMNYGPDEVQFNIIDFKSSDDNTSQDFGDYEEGRPLYIPHVRYLSFGNGVTSGQEMVRKIKVDMDMRDQFIKNSGAKSFEEYNKMAIEKGLKKMPIPFYIIDEAIQMLGGSKGYSTKQKAAHEGVSDILKTIRSKNMCIIFAGQDVPTAITDNLGNMQTFIAYGFDRAPDLKDGFIRMFKGVGANERSNQQAKELVESIGRQVSVKFSDNNQPIPSGKFALTTNGGATYDIVSVAYGNKLGSSKDEYRIIAEQIREKYKDFNEPQAIAGSKELVMASKIQNISTNSNARENERKYFLPIGVSSASMLLNELEFSNSSANTNYQCITKLEKSSFIMKGLILEIIKRMRTNPDYKDGKIYFTALPKPTAIFKDGLKDQIVKDLISNHVSFEYDKYKMANIIMDIYDEYLSRKKEEEESPVAPKFSPIFLFISGPQWIVDTDTSWIKEGNGSSFDNNINNKEQEKASKEVENAFDELGIPDEFKDLMGDIGMNIVKNDEPVKQNKVRVIDDKELREAFATIFGLGNRYSIFVFATSENEMSFIKSELKRNPNIKEDDLNFFMIYDSYNASINQADNRYFENTAFIIPSKTTSPSTIRLIDYSYENNEEFFKGL